MRTTLVALGFAAGIGLICCQSAGAVQADVSVIKQAATAASTVQQAQFYQYRTKHGHWVKCFRDLVIGPYHCHKFWR